MPSVPALALASVLTLPFAQVQPPPAPEQPSVPESAEAVLTPASLWNSITAYYRAGAQGEKIVVRAVSPSSSERLAVIEARYDAGGSERPARIRLDLGRLTIFAGDGLVRIISQQDPARMVVRSFDGPLTPAAINAVVPPVPLPQIDWVLASGQGEHQVASLAGVEWHTAAAMDNGWLRLEGQSPDARIVLIAEPTGRVRHVTVYPADGAGGIIELASEPVNVPPPHTWDIDPAGRTAVDSLELLSPPPPDVAIGARVPNLGLMSTDMLAWSLAESLRAAAVGPGDRERSAAALLVLFKAEDTDAETSASAGLRAALEAKRLLERRGLMGNGGRIGVAVHPIAVLEVQQFRAPLIRSIGERWKDRGHAGLVWTSSGSALLDRFARSASSMILIVDGEQRLAAAIPLDGRAGEVDALRAEIERVIRPRVDPIEVPVPADQPAADPSSQPTLPKESPAGGPGGG